MWDFYLEKYYKQYSVQNELRSKYKFLWKEIITIIADLKKNKEKFYKNYQT